MNPDAAFNNDGSEQCCIPEKAQLRHADDTVGRLLDELNKKLIQTQEDEPELQAATKDLETDLKLIAAEYDQIPNLVEEYRKALKDSFRQKLEEATERREILTRLTNEQHDPGQEVRNRIDDIRQRFYRNAESTLESEFVGAREKLNSARSCREQALQHKQWAQDEYEHYKDYKKVVAKDYKDKVSAWFAELDALYAKAEKLIEAEKYKAVYACSLEFNEVLDARLSRIPREEKTATRQGKTLDGMKKELTDRLRAWIIAAYEHFYWHVDWIKKEREAAKKKRLYEQFMETRREDFIREAMDVEAEETAPVC